MKLEKTRDLVFGEAGVTYYMLSQRYRGQKYASILSIYDDSPPSLIARLICETRRNIRVQLARTERRYQKAANRNSKQRRIGEP